MYYRFYIWAATCDFQQCGILTSVDSDEPVQPPLELRISKYDQEIPQSQTADNHKAPRGKATQPSRGTKETN